MSGFPPFAARPLDPVDLPEAREVAAAAGAHGVYVRNALDAPADRGGDEILGLYGAERLVGLLFFGARGNLIVIELVPLHAGAVARAIADASALWRVVLGPEPVVRALAERESVAPLVERAQVYYGVESGGVPTERCRADVRPAERRDVRALIAAALDLNRTDLNVHAWRVNRSWLRASIKRRIRQGRTLVIGEPGEPVAKVDVGSRGGAGAVFEGVYTHPSARGCGLATGIVATAACEFLGETPLVCLHVAEQNSTARRCYERAGMTRRGTCQILLRG